MTDDWQCARQIYKTRNYITKNFTWLSYAHKVFIWIQSLTLFLLYTKLLYYLIWGGGLICTDFDTNFNQGTSLDQLLESSPIFNFQEPEQENEHRVNLRISPLCYFLGNWCVCMYTGPHRWFKPEWDRMQPNRSTVDKIEREELEVCSCTPLLMFLR